jgi:hypothetical protein
MTCPYALSEGPTEGPPAPLPQSNQWHRSPDLCLGTLLNKLNAVGHTGRETVGDA